MKCFKTTEHILPPGWESVKCSFLQLWFFRIVMWWCNRLVTVYPAKERGILFGNNELWNVHSNAFLQHETEWCT